MSLNKRYFVGHKDGDQHVSQSPPCLSESQLGFFCCVQVVFACVDVPVRGMLFPPAVCHVSAGCAVRGPSHTHSNPETVIKWSSPPRSIKRKGLVMRHAVLKFSHGT